MKSLSLRMIPASLVFVPFLVGCGAEPITSDTPENAMVAVRSDIAAKAYPQDQDGFQSSSAGGATVDSLEVTGAYVMVTGLEMHGTSQAGVGELGRLRSAQTLIVFEPDVLHYVTDAEAVAGQYTLIKFEVHPRHGDLDSLMAIDSRYADFVTYGPSNSVIVTGHTYTNGVKVPFVFTSVVSFGSEAVFTPSYTLVEGVRHELRMRFLAQEAFDADGAIMDPNDIRNRSAIESNLHSSIGFFRL